MKRYRPILICSILMLNACVRNSTDDVPDRSDTQIIHACIDDTPQTKVAINGVELKWADEDALTVFEITPNGGFSREIAYKIIANSITDDGKSADFSGSPMLSGYKYIACYGSQLSLMDGNILLKLNNSVQQSASLDHINNAINLSSGTLTFDGATPLDFKFHHISTILEFNLKLAPSVAEDCCVAEIEFFAPEKPLCTGFTISPNGDIVALAEQMSNVQKLQVTGSPALSKESFFKAQMACLWDPAHTTASNNFIITIRTTDGREATITRLAKVLRSGVIYYINEVITPVDLVAQDRQALVTLFNATNGNNWTNKANWCSSKPLREWQGVLTNPTTGRVTGLSLGANNLSGHIPSEIEGLSALSQLILSNNQLSGEIPAEVGALVKLTSLDFSYNNLTGALPAKLSCIEQIGDLPNSFNLSYNRLTGKIPDAYLSYKYFAGWVLTPQQTGYGFADDAALKLDISRKDIPMTGAAFNVQVWSDRSWMTSGIPAWVSLSPASGEGNQSVAVNCQPNTTFSERTAAISFAAGVYTSSLTVVQPGQNAAISLDVNSKEVASGYNSFNVALTANTNWEANGVPAWITLNPSSGTSSRSISIACNANTTALAREATITFSAGASSTSLYVKQAGITPTISLDRSSWNFEGIQGSFTIQVTTNGGPWSVSGVPEWLTLSPSSGTGSQTVTVTHRTNPVAKDRYATLTFHAGSASAQYELRQSAGAGTISLDKSAITVDSDAGSFPLTVTTNEASWSTSNGANWILLSETSSSEGKTITVTYYANPGTTERQAIITFKTRRDEQATLTITQSGTENPMIALSKETWTANSAGESTDVSITTNHAEWYVNKVPSWVTVTPASGTGSGVATVTCQANTTSSPRSAEIYFYAKLGNNTTYKIVQITQDWHAVLTITPAELNFKGDAASQTLSVSSNTSWTATKDRDWFTLSTTGGSSGSRSISVRVTENPDNAPRSGTITLTAGTGQDQVVKTIRVTQAIKPRLSIAEKSLVAPFRTTSYQVTIESNTPWSASSDQSWCSVSPASGAGNGTLTLSLPHNTSDQARSAVVTITAGSAELGIVTHTLSVRQNPNNDFSIGDWADNGDHGGEAE